MPDTILVVEDEISLQETLAYNLKRQGYDVETAGNGLDALDAARKRQPDLILLDVMLPGMDGFEVCRTLRKEMNIPIIMLTARDEEIDKVVGLELGADDYIVKPFSMRELMARVKARLRVLQFIRESAQKAESSPESETESAVFRDLTIDFARHEARLAGNPLHLKPKEFELLVFLVQHRGRAISRDLILERVWGWEFSGDSRTVDVHIRWLREKIESDPAVPKRIITVRGAGYRFEG